MPGVEEQGRGEKATKAAYLMVKGSIGEDLCSREEFTTALRYAGFNPSHRTTSNYWTETTRQITFSQFCNIAEIEPVPTEETLVSAFQKLDEKGLGYITHDDFLLSMTTRGEKLPGSVIDNMLQDTRFNRDRKFLYPAYCQAVVETTKILSELAVDKITREEEDFSVNSQTYKVRRKTASPVKTENSLKPSSSPTKTTSLEPGAGSPLSQTSTQQGSPSHAGGDEVAWRSRVSSKGCFYFESDALISHQYQVSVPVSSTCRLAIQAQEQYKNVAPLIDVQIYLFDENKRFICRTAEYREPGEWVWQGRLEAGRYLALAHTSGARLRRRKSSPRQEPPLVERDPKIRLSKQFRKVLQDIYDRVDLDNSGSLSRAEFNLFNWRTSGEEVADEEWQVVEQNFPLHNNELTLDGFLTLHQMEAEDNQGDPRELRVTVQAMGYNRALVQDESVSFVFTFSSSEPGAALSVCGLKSGGLLLEKTVTRCAMEADRNPTRVKGANNVLVYREVTDHRITFVYQNKSESSTIVQMELNKSKGIVHSRDSEVFNLTVPKKAAVIAAHILPSTEGAEWKVLSSARIIKS